MLHGESKSDNCMRIDLLLGHMPVYSVCLAFKFLIKNLYPYFYYIIFLIVI